MRLAALRTHALGLPHTTVVKQWGENLVFKVAGKMFLIVSLDGAFQPQIERKRVFFVAPPVPGETGQDTVPAYSVLSNQSAERVSGQRMPHWQEAIDRYLESRRA